MKHVIHGVTGELTTGTYGHGGALQRWVSEGRPYNDYDRKGALIHAEISFDNEHGNLTAHFYITASLSNVRPRDMGGIGCAHDEIANAFPELAHLIKWHACGIDGPMHYVANTVYLAGDRDHNGLRKGESRQIINGLTKKPCWVLEGVPGYADKNFDGDESELPPVPVMKWVPRLRHGEGKERDLDAARQSAIWPNATDAELSVEPDELRAKLEARLPLLMAVFKGEMAAAGIAWPEA